MTFTDALTERTSHQPQSIVLCTYPAHAHELGRSGGTPVPDPFAPSPYVQLPTCESEDGWALVPDVENVTVPVAVTVDDHVRTAVGF